MKKLLLFAAVAGLGLVSASPPGKGPEPAARETRHYPPCSRTVRDSCIQRYERGVRHHDHHARGEHRGHHDHGDRHAHRVHRGDHRAHGQHATADQRPARPLARSARVTRQVAQRVRRAGERG
jgi:hypothetical protein